MPAFYNQATLRYGGETLHSNTVRGEIETALGIDLSAVPASYRPGERLAYAVHLTNSSSVDADQLSVTDDLGAYAFGASSLVPFSYVPGSARCFVNGELQAPPQVESANGALTFRNIRIPANGSASLVYAVDVNEFAPLGPGALISSTATLSGAENPNVNPGAATRGTGLPVSDSEEVHPESGAHLAFHKRLSPETVRAGEELTYTLTLENSGATPLNAADGALVTDVFDPALEITSVRSDGAAWGPESYSYDRQSGAFSTLPGKLTVPAATFAQDTQSGAWQVTPGSSVIEITGKLR